MAEPIVYPSVDGQEVQLADVDNLGAVAGLADDRLLAELLRLTPYDGTNIYKTVLPYGSRVALGGAGGFATVAPSGSGNGSITVYPFRAVIGSRNAANAAPSPNPAVNYQSDALANWRDIRSGVFVGSSTSLTQTVQLAANSSLSPRWDLVYATIAIDANGPSVSRRVKNPSTGSIATQSVASYLSNAVTVSVVTGTVAGTLPALPADSAGNYNVPLAFVRVPNPFTSTSTVSAKDIRAYAPNNGFVSLRSGRRVRPGSGNNDQSASYVTAFPWSATGGTRPGPFMAPDWVGGEELIVEVDCSNANPNNWSHAVFPSAGCIVDASIDWRNRWVKSRMAASGAYGLSTDPTAGAIRVPAVNSSPGGPSTYNDSMANTISADGILVASHATVQSVTSAQNSAIASGSQVGLVVDMTGAIQRGALCFWADTSTVPTAKLAFWIEATGQYPNV